LAYLDKLSPEDRPKVIVLECVANLGNNRQIKGRTEKGTALVVEALKERGYIGEWKIISATHFGPPQRRPRVCGFPQDDWRDWA
ncbi:MAG: DNA cytosine methyltransferase, partial [Candidatus Fonsibacter sp.]